MDRTRKDKELLLKDLCARLPYGVIVQYKGHNTIIKNKLLTGPDLDCNMEYYKPYLRPISSMTEEEVDNLFKILDINENLATEWLKVNDIGIIRLFTQQGKDFYEIAEAMDYLNSIHIDYRGLIEKGLAIEVTEENNPYKN